MSVEAQRGAAAAQGVVGRRAQRWGILVLRLLVRADRRHHGLLVQRRAAAGPWDRFGFDSFLALLDKPAIQDARHRSRCRRRCIAAVVATALGTLAGIAMARHPGKWVWCSWRCASWCSVTPEIVDAIALLIWYVRSRDPSGRTSACAVVNDGIVRLVDRPRHVLDGGGHADRARAIGGARRVARGGGVPTSTPRRSRGSARSRCR